MCSPNSYQDICIEHHLHHRKVLSRLFPGNPLSHFPRGNIILIFKSNLKVGFKTTPNSYAFATRALEHSPLHQVTYTWLHKMIRHEQNRWRSLRRNHKVKRKCSLIFSNYSTSQVKEMQLRKFGCLYQ